MNAFTRSAIRRLLAQWPLLDLAEWASRHMCRRFPTSRTAHKCEFEISSALRQSGHVCRVATLPNGARLLVPLWHETGRELYFFGSDDLRSGLLYEPETTRFFCRWLSPGDTVIDIGANLGYYTLLAARAVGPSGSCHSFEPNRALATWIAESAALNGVNSTVVVNVSAVADHTGTASFYIPVNRLRDPRASLVAGSYDAPVRELTVPVTTLDDYVARTTMTSIRLVKIDVEGAEDRVLAGSKRTLRSLMPDAVILEHAPVLLRDPARQWARNCAAMEEAGYAPHSITRDGGLEALHDAPYSDSSLNVCFTPV